MQFIFRVIPQTPSCSLKYSLVNRLCINPLLKIVPHKFAICSCELSVWKVFVVIYLIICIWIWDRKMLMVLVSLFNCVLAPSCKNSWIFSPSLSWRVTEWSGCGGCGGFLVLESYRSRPFFIKTIKSISNKINSTSLKWTDETDRKKIWEFHRFKQSKIQIRCLVPFLFLSASSP